MEADWECSLCHQLYYRPTRTKCGHTFCELCLERWLSAVRQRNPPSWWPDQQQKQATCPLCRAPISRSELEHDAELEHLIQEQEPEEAARRQQQGQVEQAAFQARQQAVKKLVVGNRHQLVERVGSSHNMHQWEFFVGMEAPEDDEQYIDHVVVQLHPTFSPPELTLWQPPFRVRRVGWGIFYLSATVVFKRQWGHPAVRLAWLLDFDGQGSYQEAEINFQPRAAAAAAGGGQTGAAAPAAEGAAAGGSGEGGGSSAGAAAAGAAGEGRQASGAGTASSPEPSYSPSRPAADNNSASGAAAGAAAGGGGGDVSSPPAAAATTLAARASRGPRAASTSPSPAADAGAAAGAAAAAGRSSCSLGPDDPGDSEEAVAAAPATADEWTGSEGLGEWVGEGPGGAAAPSEGESSGWDSRETGSLSPGGRSRSRSPRAGAAAAASDTPSRSIEWPF